MSYANLHAEAKAAITEVEFEETIERVMSTLREYSDCDGDFDHAWENVELWANNKANLIAAFKASPLYNPSEPWKIKVDQSFARSSSEAYIELLFEDLANSVYDICEASNFLRVRCPRTAYVSKECAETISDYINYWELNIPHPHANEKTSKYIRKFLTACGTEFVAKDKFEVNGRQVNEASFAKLADALNPTEIKRPVILSIDPVDYLLMSHGNSWSSCYCIDPDWSGQTYSGCYSSGTWSYMNDKISMIAYSVSDGIKANYAEAPKILRQVVMFDGNQNILHSRLYPQSNDSEGSDLYREMRQAEQKIISEVFDLPNYWEVRENEGDFLSSGDFKGYDDTYYFKNKVKVSTNVINPQKMRYRYFGQIGYCPECGGELEDEKYICKYCADDQIQCESCGNWYDHDSEDIHLIDEAYYCNDCCFYCDYHNEWETGESEDVWNIEYGYWMTYCKDVVQEFQEDEEIFYCEYHDRFEKGDLCRADDSIACEEGMRNWRYEYCSGCGMWYPLTEFMETQEEDICDECYAKRHKEESENEEE